MKKLILIAGGSTAVYFVLAMLMAVVPGYALSMVPPGPNVKPLTPTEAAGRDVYVANGCSYCHTQQVRPLAQDLAFGRPSAAGDFAYQTPELLGSERTGPDLTDVGTRRGSDVWQYMHLYNPRAVVPQSIMPSFAWMFKVVDKAPEGVAAVPVPAAFAPAHGVVIPDHDAKVLVAYLLSRKQPSLLPPTAAASAAPAAAPAAPPAAAPAPVKLAANPPPAATPAAPAADVAHGKELYDNNCAACHQATGLGLPGAFPPLKGNAVANDPDPTEHIAVVLFGTHDKVIDGVKYASPMPPWGSQFSDQEAADIINYERSAWGNHGEPVTAADVAAVRAKGK
jgi:cytochrome c oxidase cbb3-type subunit 2